MSDGCRRGTLSESFAKLGDSIFFWQPAAAVAAAATAEPAARPALLVNQFVSATAKLDHALGAPGVAVHQAAGFPADPHSTATLTVRVPAPAAAAAAAVAFDIKIRVPAWATAAAANSVRVNGVAVGPGASLKPGSYLTVSRPSWADGDTIEVHFPLRLWSSPLNDYHPEHNATVRRSSAASELSPTRLAQSSSCTFQTTSVD